MADAQTQTNNPAGEPPAETDTGPSSDDILSVFELGDTASVADQIAGGNPPAPTPQPAAASPAGTEAAGGATAPSPAVTPPAGEAPAPTAAPTPAPSEPSAAPAAPSAAPEQPAAAPQPALQIDEGELRRASLEAQVAALTQTVQELRASPQPAAGQPAQPAAPETGQPTVPTVPFKYGLTLPEPVQQMLLSEDPKQNVQAIQAIVNDLGTIVHHSVVAQVRQEIQGAIQGLLQQAEQTVHGEQRQTAAEQAREQYYQKFPAHKDPLMLPLVQSEAQKLAAEFPHLQWGDQYINALGVRVQNAIAQLTGAAPQPSADPTAQPATTGTTPPARPAAHLPSGPRPAGVTETGDLAETIVDVLDPFST